MHSPLCKFTLVLNSASMFWKLLVFEFLLSVFETFLCSMFALLATIFSLLNALQLLLLFGGTLMYL
jgi:hypothetical protein